MGEPNSANLKVQECEEDYIRPQYIEVSDPPICKPSANNVKCWKDTQDEEEKNNACDDSDINFADIQNNESHKSEDETYHERFVIRKSDKIETKYNLRKDVITKTILRAAKKYYANEFKNYYDYTKGNNRKLTYHDSQMCDKVMEFINLRYPEYSTNTMKVIIVSF